MIKLFRADQLFPSSYVVAVKSLYKTVSKGRELTGSILQQLRTVWQREYSLTVKRNHFIAVLILRQAQKFGWVEIPAKPLQSLSTAPVAKAHGSQTLSFLYMNTPS